MSAKRKRFFAQTAQLGQGHKARHFHELEEARLWLRENGGGTISDRQKANNHYPHWPLKPFSTPWGFVEAVDGIELSSSRTAP